MAPSTSIAADALAPAAPLDRRALTARVLRLQGERGRDTLRRLVLLDGRDPSALRPAQRRALARIDRHIAQASLRIDALKAARAEVNAARGRRWLDRLELDVLVGGALGIPGLFSGSVMGGVSLDEADPDTGLREKGFTAFVMPAFSVGGYAKLDVSYTRAHGARFGGGGGADFLGVWGGPGGRRWGNVFAGGLWLPQVIGLGLGYGVEREEPYGALILTTFWPPFAPAAGRVDTVVRHPALAFGAKRGAELVRIVAESRLIAGGKSAFTRLGRRLVGPTGAAFAKLRERRQTRRRAEDPRPYELDALLAAGRLDEAWTRLRAWLEDTNHGLEPRIHLVRWLVARGQPHDAQQLAEGLVSEHPRAFAALQALADVTHQPPLAEAST